VPHTPCTPVNYVNFELLLSTVGYAVTSVFFMFQRVTVEPYVNYWNPGMIPYSRLQITIKAFTYWGASPQVRAIMHSPPSVPTEPTNPRVFVSYSRNPVREDQVCSNSFEVQHLY
jgi:proto-oncogene tyrosine-protein kinase ROS